MLLKSFYTRELWFHHLAEFRTNPLSFDMFRLNLSQTLALACQGVSKAGHRMHILALMCTTKDCIMIQQNVYKRDNSANPMLTFLQLSILYTLNKQDQKKMVLFLFIYCIKDRWNHLCLCPYSLSSNISLTDTVRFPMAHQMQIYCSPASIVGFIARMLWFHTIASEMTKQYLSLVTKDIPNMDPNYQPDILELCSTFPCNFSLNEFSKCML